MTTPNHKAIVQAVQKKFGSDSLNLLLKHSEFGSVSKFISFGHWGLDKIVSGLYIGGGVPVGRLTEIYGAPSSGKSLLVAHLIASCQKMGGIAILDDTEHAYEKHFGELIGIDNDNLLYSASESVEEVFDKMEYTIKYILSSYPDAIILYAWDSLALVSSLKERDREMLDAKEGYNVQKAKAIHEGIRKVVSLIGKYNVALVITNHSRVNIGVLFGDKETTPGGDAVPFYASVRLRLSKTSMMKTGIDKDADIIGVKGEALVKKNKIAPPFKSCKYNVLFDHGVLYTSGCVELLIKDKLVTESSKGWYEMKGYDGKFHKSTLEKFFDDNPDQFSALYEAENED